VPGRVWAYLPFTEIRAVVNHWDSDFSSLYFEIEMRKFGIWYFIAEILLEFQKGCGTPAPWAVQAHPIDFS
jgi:hypothetical protein